MKYSKFILPVILLFLFFLLLNSCNNPVRPIIKNKNRLKGRITISGSFALYPLTVRWCEEFRKQYPDIHIDVSAGGAGKGVADALSEMADIGMVSRELHDSEIKKGAWYIAVAKDAVVPIISSNNPFINEINKKGLRKSDFENIFLTGEVKKWNEVLDVKDNFQINVFTRADACGAAETWAKFTGGNQEDLQGIGVFGDPGIVDVVKNDIYSIGYSSVIFAFNFNTRKKTKGINIVPVDTDNNGKIDNGEKVYYNMDTLMSDVSKNIFPTPPARNLYYVSAGVPKDTLVNIFLRWILIEGQRYISSAGFVKLDSLTLNESINKISKTDN